MVNQEKVAALLFDLGGVVIDINFDLAFQAWESQSNLSLEEMRRRFAMDTAYQQHERGEIKSAEYFNHLRQQLEIEGNDEDIERGWNAIFVGEITQSLNYIRAAKNRLPCFAFTNSNPTHQTEWETVFPQVTACFDRIFVSSELGLRKPDYAAFDAIAQATGIGLSSMLFFDDTLENIEGALNAGLQAIHVRTPMDVKQALVAIGVLA